MNIDKRNIFLFLYLFYIIYLPDVSGVIPYLKPSTVIIIFALVNLWVFRERLVNIFRYQSMFSLIAGIGVTFLLMVIRQLMNAGLYVFDLVPNVVFGIQLINFFSFILWYQEINGKMTKKDLWHSLLILAIVQAVVSYIMLIVPPLKEIAHLLFAGGKGIPEKHLYLLSYRIYGIGTSYTFSLSLVQGFAATIALLFAFYKKSLPYLFLSIFIMGSSVLNGRTGLLIYLLVAYILIIREFLINFKWRYIAYILAMIFVGGIVLWLLSVVNPSNAEWILNSFNEFYLLLFKGELTGNLSYLGGSFLHVPEGIFNNLFGTGYSIYNEMGSNIYNVNSDIGYINDLFKGGILLIALIYFPAFQLIRHSSINPDFRNLALLFILLSNYKGQTMLVTAIILIPLMFAGLDLINAKERRKAHPKCKVFYENPWN